MDDLRRILQKSCLSPFATLLGMLMSSDRIRHNEPSLDVTELLFLGDEFPPSGGGFSWDPELLSLDSVFSHDAKAFVRLVCDLLGSAGRCR